MHDYGKPSSAKVEHAKVSEISFIFENVDSGVNHSPSKVDNVSRDNIDSSSLIERIVHDCGLNTSSGDVLNVSSVGPSDISNLLLVLLIKNLIMICPCY